MGWIGNTAINPCNWYNFGASKFPEYEKDLIDNLSKLQLDHIYAANRPTLADAREALLEVDQPEEAQEQLRLAREEFDKQGVHHHLPGGEEEGGLEGDRPGAGPNHQSLL